MMKHSEVFTSQHQRFLREALVRGYADMHQNLLPFAEDLAAAGLVSIDDGPKSPVGVFIRIIPSLPPTNDWGLPYNGHVAYLTDDWPVWLYRNGHLARFYGPRGQVGPEQVSVGHAITYAAVQGWTNPRG